MVNEQIGKLIEGESHRDAIHVAVAPVTAHKKLHPGDEIGVSGDGTKSADGTPVGIVDPFLKKPVKADERFFIWLFPNTVTDIHHHWLHPAFDSNKADAAKALAKARISEMANAIGGQFGDYESLMAHVESCCEGGEHYVEHDSEFMRGQWHEFEDEFWKLRETITGKKKPEEYTPIFCCTC